MRQGAMHVVTRSISFRRKSSIVRLAATIAQRTTVLGYLTTRIIPVKEKTNVSERPDKRSTAYEEANMNIFRCGQPHALALRQGREKERDNQYRIHGDPHEGRQATGRIAPEARFWVWLW